VKGFPVFELVKRGILIANSPRSDVFASALNVSNVTVTMEAGDAVPRTTNSVSRWSTMLSV
jgi:hypothetical protein